MLSLAALALSVSLAGAEVPLAWTAHRTVLLQARAPDGAAAPGVEVWLVRGGLPRRSHDRIRRGHEDDHRGERNVAYHT